MASNPLARPTLTRAVGALFAVAALAIPIAARGAEAAEGPASAPGTMDAAVVTSAASEAAGPLVARVDGQEIRQQDIERLLANPRDVPWVLQHRLRDDLPPRQAALECLIDTELAYAKAQTLDLRPGPASGPGGSWTRRRQLVDAYFEQLTAQVPSPHPAQVQAFYDDHPVLFSKRRVYFFDEYRIEYGPERTAELRQRLSAARTRKQLESLLRRLGLRHDVKKFMYGPEHLPLTQLDKFAAMRAGHVEVSSAGPLVRVLVLNSTVSEPMPLHKAAFVIERYLINEARRRMARDELATLRAMAYIEYLGEFAR